MGRVRSLCAPALCAFLALGCGGGGGGTAVQDNSWLSIAPSTVTASTVVGVSAPFTISVTSTKTISQALYPVFVDNAGVIDPNATIITALSQMQYKADFATSKTLAEGSYKGNFSLWLYTDSQHTTAYAGSPWTIPYQITVGPVRVAHKLLPNALGAAFSSTPAGSRLTQTILVADNLAKATSWQAVSDQPWLTVTGTGTTGSPGAALVLTADPTSLPGDTISYAIVTLTSSDTTVQPIDKIQVGLWKGSVSAQRTDVLTGMPFGEFPGTHVCADPVRPYVYLTYNNYNNIVDCYNIYTATKVASITLPTTWGKFQAGSMAIAPDGSKLFVAGNSEGAGGLVYKVSLPGMTLDANFGSLNVNDEITYVRPNGVGVVLSSSGPALLASTCASLTSTGTWRNTGDVAATADSGFMFTANSYAGNGVTSRFSLDFSEFGGGTLVAKVLNCTAGTPEYFFGLPIAISRDGARLYLIDPTLGLVHLDPVTLSVLATFPPVTPTNYTGLRVGGDGRVYCSTQNYNTGLCRIVILGSDDSLVSTKDVTYQYPAPGGGYYPGVGGYMFDVSADSMVVVVNSMAAVQFFPVYP